MGAAETGHIDSARWTAARPWLIPQTQGVYITTDETETAGSGLALELVQRFPDYKVNKNKLCFGHEVERCAPKRELPNPLESASSGASVENEGCGACSAPRFCPFLRTILICNIERHREE